MSAKFISLNDSLYNYLTACRTHDLDGLLTELRRETEALGDISRMLISVEQGNFLRLLAAALNVRCAVEVGTFTGCSSTCLATGMGEKGKLLCFDQSEEWTQIAGRYWQKAGVANRIELILGSARETLPFRTAGLEIDLAFIDADKTSYDFYYETLLPRVKPNGIIIFDNMLWGGRLIQKPLDNPDGMAIDALNQKLAQDPRIESVLVPIADGLHICRKK